MGPLFEKYKTYAIVGYEQHSLLNMNDNALVYMSFPALSAVRIVTPPEDETGGV